jgi:hypothetical protein
MIAVAQKCKLKVFSKCQGFCFELFNFFKASYGTQLPPMSWNHKVVDLGFSYKYFGTDYAQVSISSNGYVCLGYNSNVGIKPGQHLLIY